MISQDALGALVKKVRNKRKMSISELSRISGVTRPTIYRIEEGLRYPRLDTLDLIFKALEYHFVIGGGRQW